MQLLNSIGLFLLIKQHQYDPVNRCFLRGGRSFSFMIGMLFFCLLTVGCGRLQKSLIQQRDSSVVVENSLPNPLVVPMMDRWYLMDQISDELDNYFRIYREERIRVIDGILTEGWIETHPQIGGTLMEPWKKDSTPGFERTLATLQTIRRFAKVRVIPFGNSYQIDLKVFKELEDLERPVGSPFGGATTRQYHTLGPLSNEAPLAYSSKGWIPLGRDFALEQTILSNIQSRLRKSIE
jgi:hypothetical protein